MHAELIEPRRFERTNRDAAAENDDRVCLFEWIFDDEPAPDAEEQHHDCSEREEDDDRKYPGRTRSRSARRFRVIKGRKRK